MDDNLREPAPVDPAASLPSPRASPVVRWLRRTTGGPGSPLFDAASRARRGAAASRRAVRRVQQRAQVLSPGPHERISVLDGIRTRAVVDPAATPRDVHLRTAVWLRDLLDQHGIEYFAWRRNSLYLDFGVRAADAERLRTLIGDEWNRRAIALGVYSGGVFAAESPRGGPPRGSFARARAVRMVLATAPAGVAWAWPLDVGVTVHFWPDLGDGVLGAPLPNRYTPYLLRSSQQKPAQLLHDGEEFRSLQDLAIPHVDDVDFAVDLVYTWVQGDDPDWRSRMVHKREEVLGHVTDNAIADARFDDLEELRYSLRSVHMYAPWIRKIWIVTDAQVPPWLATSDDRVTVIDHRQIWDSAEDLPVFNSHAIEARLHHIPGLAEHYIYFNDDMMFGQPVQASDFFTAGGLMKIFPSIHQIGLGGKTLHEGAAHTAAKNDREILIAATGAMQTQRLKHAGYPQLRSVAMELEERFPDYYRRTAASTFRSTDDISSVSLQSWYAYRTGKATVGTIPFRYIDLVTHDSLRELESLLRHRTSSVVCLNQSENAAVDPHLVQTHLHRFLDAYLPVPSPYEVTS